MTQSQCQNHISACQLVIIWVSLIEHNALSNVHFAHIKQFRSGYADITLISASRFCGGGGPTTNLI